MTWKTWSDVFQFYVAKGENQSRAADRADSWEKNKDRRKSKDHKMYVLPGDTFVGPNGEQLVAVPMEPTREMFDVWRNTIPHSMAPHPQWITDDERDIDLLDDARYCLAEWTAMIEAATKKGPDR